MKETSDYLDLHLEVARYFQKEEVEQMSKALKLLYDHPPQVGYLMLHTFPTYMFPFATVDQWEEWGRTVNTEYVGGTIKYNDDVVGEKYVYSIQATEGKPLPDFPTNHPPPYVEEDIYDSISKWIDGMAEADGLQVVRVPNLHQGGGYNHKRNEIIIPMGVSKGYELMSYMHSYMTTLDQRDTLEMDSEDLDEYHGVINTCTYKLFKDRGYDTGDYGLTLIVSSVETFDRYLEIEEDIENMLSYFEDPE